MGNIWEALKEEFRKENKLEVGALDYKDAIKKAYPDMSRRALGHKENKRDHIFNKIFSDPEFNRFRDGLSGGLKFKDQTDFDDWHNECCEKLTKAMQDSGFEGTYGRAQKLINMSLKYMYCCDDSEEKFQRCFQYCHMPLDGYTLKWVMRVVKPKSSSEALREIKNDVAWSKINTEQYKTIQEAVRNYLKDGDSYTIKIKELKGINSVDLPKEPIRAEFVIWAGEKLLVKYNELVNGIDAYCEGEQEKDSWLIDKSFSQYLIGKYKDIK